MSAWAVPAAVAAFIVARERRIYKRNKTFRAQAAQLVTPPVPRWWQSLLTSLILGALMAAAFLALLRFAPTGDTTPGPPTPLDGTPSVGPSDATHTPTSHSSTPKGASR
ncbi:hypothetical protein ABH935_006654 [Catenulispora sp. GAS73]|uniref:hypothetical protein n=1 Tax=Catenulispora sp. GAS73 TaxID=3156269 RepID=UPI00351860E2